jgi:hypothetical protein
VSTTEFVDTGASGTGGTARTSAYNNVWTVKNLFELKSARTSYVRNNIFENHWKQAQPGLGNRVDAAEFSGHVHLV